MEHEQMLSNPDAAILAEHGYTVLVAGYPTEALLLSESHPGRIDLLLTDVVMPGMSGREVAARLAQSRPEMKALYMSGYMDDVVASYGALGPGTEVAQKPFLPDALALKVRQVFERPGKPAEEGPIPAA